MCIAEPREARGQGAPWVETLVASRFAYEAFRRSSLSSLKPKTLVRGPLSMVRVSFTVRQRNSTVHRRNYTAVVKHPQRILMSKQNRKIKNYGKT